LIFSDYYLSQERFHSRTSEIFFDISRPKNLSGHQDIVDPAIHIVKEVKTKVTISYQLLCMKSEEDLMDRWDETK